MNSFLSKNRLLQVTALSAFLMAFDSAETFAQTIEQTERGRGASYQPTSSVTDQQSNKALRAGGFLLRPIGSLRASYDDNIDAEEDNERDDIILNSEIGLGLQSRLRRHSLNAEMLLGYDYFVQNNDDSDYRIQVLADGRLDFTRQTSASGTLRYNRDRQNREEADISPDSEDDVFHTIGSGIEFGQELRIFRWTIGVDAERIEYEESTSADRDRNQMAIVADLNLDLTNKLSLFLSPSASRLNYDTTDDFTGFDRDETRYAVLTGVEFQATNQFKTDVGIGYAFELSDDPSDDDTDGILLEAGFEYRLSESLGTSLRATYNDAQDSDLEDSGSAAINVIGEARYAFGQKTALAVAVSRAVTETDVLGANEKIQNNLALRLTRLLTDDIGLTFDGSIGREEFDGIERDDDMISAGVTFDWALTDSTNFDLSYKYSQRDSDAAGEDFKRNIATIGLSTSF